MNTSRFVLFTGYKKWNKMLTGNNNKMAENNFFRDRKGWAKDQNSRNPVCKRSFVWFWSGLDRDSNRVERGGRHAVGPFVQRDPDWSWHFCRMRADGYRPTCLRKGSTWQRQQTVRTAIQSRSNCSFRRLWPSPWLRDTTVVNPLRRHTTPSLFFSFRLE